MKGEKEIDAVKLMRELRQAVDKQLEGKSYAEQRRYLDEHVPLKRKNKKRVKERKTA